MYLFIFISALDTTVHGSKSKNPFNVINTLRRILDGGAPTNNSESALLVLRGAFISIVTFEGSCFCSCTVLCSCSCYICCSRSCAYSCSCCCSCSSSCLCSCSSSCFCSYSCSGLCSCFCSCSYSCCHVSSFSCSCSGPPP